MALVTTAHELIENLYMLRHRAIESGYEELVIKIDEYLNSVGAVNNINSITNVNPG
jgi:hypothetical protein